MRLALQALFSAIEANEEGTTRRALLERRLRTSDRSAGFFRRLRDVVDDETLLAPEVFAEESFPDANVVAEYLDAQAPPELTSEYEEACWNSPEMLAEIGRCYDILNNDSLSNVVAPKNCRRRLYYIAWEESAVDVSTEKKSSNVEEDASILTNFAPADSEKAETNNASERKESEKRSKVGNGRRNSDAKRKNRSDSAKSAKSVSSALAAERSWGRRFKRLSGRLALALGIFGACYCGWQGLSDDKRSETFQLETAKEEPTVANVAVEQNATEKAPLRPTTISSANLAETPPTSLLDEPGKPMENGADDDILARSSEENEPYKLAVLPNFANDGTALRVDGEATPAQTRSGLTESEPWENRPSLEIPAQNNDVFGKTRRY